jgi:histidinol-phosphate phosphatase family protein
LKTSRPSRRKLPLILLDRDGTLIEEGDYLKDPEQVKLLPGVVTGLRRLKRAGYTLAVVTNQSGVGRGYITMAQMRRVNARFLALLQQHRAPVDALYWCPHAPEKRCACRKPKLGMVRRAARQLGVPWRGSFSVGDRLSDVLLGQRTGGHGVLVLTGYGAQWAERHDRARPDFKAADFAEAVQWILNSKGKERKR